MVTGFSTALERGDADALVALLTEDVTWSMPPLPHWYRGLAAVTDFAARAAADPVRLVAAPARRRQRPGRGRVLPAERARTHAAWSIDVLTLRGDRIAEITAFIDADAFRLFGLPARLP